MVIQVNYQTKRDAADPHAEVEHTEFFESSAIPDKTTIGHELILPVPLPIAAVSAITFGFSRATRVSA